MDKYLKTREVLKLLNIETFQLFDLCKKGELQAYNEYGKKIVGLDSCEKTKKLSYEVILYGIRMQEGPKPEGDSLRRRITEELKRKRAREIYDAQPLDTPIIPEGCVGFDYRLSNNATIAEQKMTEFMRFFFKERDIKSYEIDYDLYYPNKEVAKFKKQDIPSADIQDDTAEEGLEDFPSEIIDLMNEARQEIELIYKGIKEGEGFKEISEEAVNRRMEDALNYFEEYMDSFKTISKEDLINRKIYDTSYDQYARRVKGMLLQAIMPLWVLRPF